MLNEIKINITKLEMTVKKIGEEHNNVIHRPPIYPANNPSVNPIKVAMIPATKPICSETRAAATNSVSTSDRSCRCRAAKTAHSPLGRHHILDWAIFPFSSSASVSTFFAAMTDASVAKALN
jgi:hypothetical protein